MRDRGNVVKHYENLLCKWYKDCCSSISLCSRLHDTNYSRLNMTSKSMILSDMSVSLMFTLDPF